MSLGRRAFVGAGWYFVSIVLQAALQVVVLAVIARFVERQEFGIVAIANVVLGLVSLAAQGGLGAALIQRSVLADRHVGVALSLAAVLGAIGSGVLWALAPPASAYFEEPLVDTVLKVMSVGLVPLTLAAVAEGLLERELGFRQLMWINGGAYAFGYAPVAIVLAVAGWGVWALVLAFLAQTLTRTVWLLVRAPVRRPVWPGAREAIELLRFGGGLTLLQVFTFVSRQADHVVVGRLLGAASLGAYRMAFLATEMQRRFLGGALDRAMFPAMSRIQTARERLASVYLRAVGASGLILIPSSVMMILLAPEVVGVVLGARWSAVVVPLQILFLQGPFRGVLRVTDSLLNAQGVVYRSALRRGLLAGSIVLLSWAGSRWGLPGVAVGVTVAFALNFATMVGLGIREVGTSWPALHRALAPGTLLGAVAALASAPLVCWMRSAGVAPAWILAASGAAALGATAGTILLFPRSVGPSGRWLLDQIRLAAPRLGWLLPQPPGDGGV